MLLRSCYAKSLEVLVKNDLRPIAFPRVSTVIFGYTNENAAKVAFEAVVDFFTDNLDKVDQVPSVQLGIETTLPPERLSEEGWSRIVNREENKRKKITTKAG